MIVEGNGFSYALENRLIKKLDIMIDRCIRDKPKLDAWLAIEGSEGCLAGDTQIQVSRGKNSRRYSIKKLYNQYNQDKDKILKKHFNLDLISSYVRSYNGKEIRLHKIKDVMYSGNKLTYLLTLDNGKSIKATASHKFLTRVGWFSLEELKIGDEIMCDSLNAKKSGRKKLKLYDIQLKVGKNHPYASEMGRVEVHRLIYESRLNGLEFTEFLDNLLNEPEECKKFIFVDTSEYCIHHKDGCHYNNAIENLELKKKEDHLAYHGNEQYSNFSQGSPVFSKVVSIQEQKVEEVYDIECEEPYRNFTANGIIVHNSGKSNTACACAYYVKQKTGHDVHLFFRLEPLIKMAQQTEGKIFIWDEPSLDSLSTDQLKTLSRNLLRLAMTIRKRRHFFFINFTKFWKFSEYIIVDRCLGMIHMYSKNEIEMGKSVYIKKRNLEKLWNEYNKSKRRSYGKLRAFWAAFPEVMGENLEKMGFFVDGKPNATYADYEKAKDRAINSIGKDEKPKSKKEGKYEQAYRELRKKIADLDYKNIKNKEDLARKMGVGKRTFQSWGHLEGEDAFEGDKEAKKLGLDDNVHKGDLSSQDDNESDESDEFDDEEASSEEDKDQLQKLIEEMDKDNDKEETNSSKDDIKPNWRR